MIRPRPLHTVLVAVALLALGCFVCRESSAAEWEELPVAPALGPAVTGHLEKIAGRGARVGNRPGNSYSRVGTAAVAGWRALDAVSPRESSSGCGAVAAVRCELRQLRPSVALIMFGTNDLEDFTAVRFRHDLARLAKLVSGAGTIPVISTIPPRRRRPFSQRVPRFNAEIAALAENRALPLWNLWRQMVDPDVPDRGLSEDGVHPSVLCPPCTAIDFRPAGLRQGYALRNLGALLVLDRLRHRIPLGDSR